jgi:hypothetical protein
MPPADRRTASTTTAARVPIEADAMTFRAKKKCDVGLQPFTAHKISSSIFLFSYLNLFYKNN